MPNTPILTKIEEEMASLIEAIRLGDYWFDWGPCNEHDMAKMKFPTALIYLEDENSLDERDGAWGQAYFNEVIFRVEVRADLQKEYENPVFQINKEFNKALDDLKRLFGVYWNLNGDADTIMYLSSEREYETSGDIFVPGKLITRWLVRYEQGRTTPDQVSC